MCGIVGYIGKRRAVPILLSGLKSLEYRGYDSAGIAILDDELLLYKKQGKVADLEEFLKDKNVKGNIGIAHTGWATHGEPSDINAHPHYSKSKKLAIIHNGIIENYGTLKKELINRGYVFLSETDTEVLIHLIEDIQVNENVDLLEAIRKALNQVIGAYAIVIIDKDSPDELIVARKGSPLVIGVGNKEFFVASDATPIVEYTTNVVFMNEEEIAVLSRNGEIKLINIKNQKTPFNKCLKIFTEKS